MIRRPPTARLQEQNDAAKTLDPRDQRVLAGRLENLPPLNSKVVRIFTSSTFTDTQVERNTLMEHVYPKLKDFCRHKHGLEFQVVDMRWGVTDEATDDHMTVDVCLNEIKNCQKVSVGPNFVLFLGMKYGYRPVPIMIPVSEFDKLKQEIEINKADLMLLNQWYIQDSNAQPPVYVLVPISTHYTYFIRKNLKTLYDRDQTAWWDTLGKLQKMFRKAASTLYNKGQLTPEQYHNYFMSVTEREIAQGLLKADDPDKHCLTYFRSILDIENVPVDKARNFIDISYDRINNEPQELLDKLRNRLEELTPSRLPESNVREYNLNWVEPNGIEPVKDEVHAAYLDEFCEHFESNMMRLIEQAVESQNKRDLDSSFKEVYSETLQHLHACQNFCAAFQGRQDNLQDISDYLKSSAQVPLVIYGQSGCGKTSIMAKAYSQVTTLMPSSNYPVTIIRFLGTSPNSSLVVSLVRNICQQIAINYHHLEEEIPTELSLLVQHFKKMLTLATEKKPLVIFMDSIDQLSTAYQSRQLTWLPVNLPKHVKIVVSTLPICEEDNLLDTFKKKLPHSTHFIEVKKLGTGVSTDILAAWLQNAGRTVTEKQQKIISSAIEICSLPLFLRLVFDQICRWRSFDPPEVTQLAYTIHDCIDKLFDLLEVRYGKVFVSSTFAYLSISRDGLSEMELEDILSLDDEVLNSVYQYHRPPVRRIPPLLWTRLRSEIPNYLTEREADGVTIINWYHRQFFEAAKARYLHNMNTVKNLHSLLADYFLGVWGEKPKPFRYTEDQKRMFLLSPDEMDSEADRLVPKQPLVFFNDGKLSSYNCRKLSQLPYHLLRAERMDDLEKYVLLDYNWLHAKLSAMPLQAVLADFNEVLRRKFDPEIKVLLDSLRLAGSSMTRFPDMLGTQIVGRLVPYYHDHHKIKQLIDKCDSDGAEKNVLIPAHHCLHTPGGPLQYSLVGHPGAPFGIVVTSDKKYLVSVSRICIIWDIDIGDVWRQVEPKIRGIMQGLSLCPDDQHAVCYSNPANQIITITIMTGEVKIFPNPFPSEDKLRGLRCTNTDILVWASMRWSLLKFDGTVTAKGDFTSENCTILDMILSDKPDKPIVKLQESEESKSGYDSCCILRMISKEVEDFRFATSLVLGKSFETLYACSVQKSTPNSDLNGQPHLKYRTFKYQVLITQYTKKNKHWVSNMVIGETHYTVYALTLSQDENLLVATIEPGFIIWNMTKLIDGKPARIDLSLPLGKKNFPGSKGLCVFSRGARYFMAGSRKILFVYDLKKQTLLKEISAHFDRMLDMISVVTEDVNIAITSSSDRSIRIWNFDNIQKAVPVTEHHDKEIESIYVSSTSNYAVCVLRDAIGLWDVSKGTMLQCLTAASTRDSTLTSNRLPVTGTRYGEIIKMTHAVISKNSRFVIGADTQKVIFWETETGDNLHRHLLPVAEESKPRCIVSQLLITDDDTKVIAILRSKFNRLKPDDVLQGMGIAFKIPVWEVTYQFEFQTKIESKAVLTKNNLYVVMPCFDQKAKADCIGVWHINTGTFLYSMSLTSLDIEQFDNLLTVGHELSQVVVVDSEKATIIETNKKHWKKGGFIIKTVQGWTGHCTSDGKYGVRRTPDKKTLEMFSLSTGKSIKALYSGQHPGDTEGSICITKNDQHVVYHQHRYGTIHILRLSTDLTLQVGVAICKPEATVTGLSDTSDGTELVMGLSDGRLLVFVIADPVLPENRKKLQQLRTLSKYQRTSTLHNSAKARSRWGGAVTVARIAAKAKIASDTKSKICVIS